MTPIDTATNTPGAAIPVGGEPVRVAITPDGKTVYVINEFSNSVTPIDTATNTPGAAIAVGSVPSGSRSPRTARPRTSPTGLELGDPDRHGDQHAGHGDHGRQLPRGDRGHAGSGADGGVLGDGGAGGAGVEL